MFAKSVWIAATVAVLGACSSADQFVGSRCYEEQLLASASSSDSTWLDSLLASAPADTTLTGVVYYASGAEAVREAIVAAGGEVVYEFTLVNATLAGLSPAAVRTLQHDPNVARVHIGRFQAQVTATGCPDLDERAVP